MREIKNKKGVTLGDILSYAALAAVIVYCALIAVQAGLAL